MRKSLGLVLTLIAALYAGTGRSPARQTILQAMAGAAEAASVEKQTTINGSVSHYAVIAPTYLGTGNVGPQSYIRLFNGAGLAGGTSTFSVTVVGAQTGQAYGTSFNVMIPHLASIQYSLSELVGLAGATPGSFANGDSGYAVYLQNSDQEAGYQHVVYDWTTNLFENLSSCGSLLNEQMVSLHNELVLANVHTSKIANDTFPSTIAIHNYYNVPITYTLTVFNAGGRTATNTLSPNSGKRTCQLKSTTVQGNSTVLIPFSTIESNSACVLDSDENYANITVADQSGGLPNAVITHLIHVSAYNGNSNLTDVCAVNKITPGSTGTGGGSTSPYL